jgi:hypothetical protein
VFTPSLTGFGVVLLVVFVSEEDDGAPPVEVVVAPVVPAVPVVFEEVVPPVDEVFESKTDFHIIIPMKAHIHRKPITNPMMTFLSI